MNKESFIISCIRRLREYGEGIVLADQSISSLKEVVKSNVYTIICLSQTGQKDRKEVSNVLGLDASQSGITNFLEVGQGLIRLAGRFPFVQLLSFPLIEPKNISEKELDKINAENKRVQYLLSKVKKRHAPETKLEPEPPTPDTETVTDDMKDFLMAVNLHQFKREMTLTVICKQAGLTAGQGSRISAKAEKMGLITIVQPKGLGKGNPRYPVLTDAAYKLLNIKKKTYCKRGGTGIVHTMYQYFIAELFSDYKVILEYNLSGKFVDAVIFVQPDCMMGIEIELSVANLKKNIIDDINNGIHHLIVACIDEKTLSEANQIISDLDENIKNRTKVYLISDVLRMKSDEIINNYKRSG